MTDPEPSQPRMMRAIAWFVLSMLSAVVVFAAPLSVDGLELSSEEHVSSTYSGDASPLGHDFVPFRGLSFTPRLLALDLGIADQALPRAVHFRSRLLRYAPKNSPPHTA